MLSHRNRWITARICSKCGGVKVGYHARVCSYCGGWIDFNNSTIVCPQLCLVVIDEEPV